MTKEYRNPVPTVDIIIEIQDQNPNPYGGYTIGSGDGKWIQFPPQNINYVQATNFVPKGGIVLIRRKNEPFGWALPGGFVDEGEKFADAAVREAAEETGLMITQAEQFYTYSDPARDPRRHVTTTVYIAKAIGYPVAADDAAEAIIVDPENMGSQVDELCFDHRKIIADYIIFKRTGQRPTNE